MEKMGAGAPEGHLEVAQMGAGGSECAAGGMRAEGGGKRGTVEGPTTKEVHDHMYFLGRARRPRTMGAGAGEGVGVPEKSSLEPQKSPQTTRHAF